MNKLRRRAVIDLGTNTFHLLIADVTPQGHLHTVFRERRFVKLADDGIDVIGPKPYARAMEALLYFRSVLDRYTVENLLAFGTAALRTASNGPQFVEEAHAKTKIDIKLIPGDEEARLITQGVMQALPSLHSPILIMDIGGGSTEFIIANQEGPVWRQSFMLGISVLRNLFHKNDPISPVEIQEMEAHLTQELLPLFEAIQNTPTHHLVGAAGTFDLLSTVLKAEPCAPPNKCHELDMTNLSAWQNRMIKTSVEERLLMDNLPPERVDLIVSAMVLLRYVINRLDIQRITVSDYAMKEGILLDSL